MRVERTRRETADWTLFVEAQFNAIQIGISRWENLWKFEMRFNIMNDEKFFPWDDREL